MSISEQYSMKCVYIGNNNKLIHGKTYDIFEYHWDGQIDKNTGLNKVTKYVNCNVKNCVYIIDSTLDEIWSKDFKTLEEVRNEKINSIVG